MKQTLTNIITGTALAGSMATGAIAQDATETTPVEQPVAITAEAEPRLDINYHSLVDTAGLSTQNLLTYTRDGDHPLTVKGMLETLPSGDTNTGFDLSTDVFRLNLGYGLRDSGLDNPLRALGTLTFDDGFIGAKYQHLANGDDHFSVHGGLSLTDRLDVRGTIGTAGASGVAFLDLDNGGTLGIGGGVSDDGAWDANLSYSDDTKWAYIRGGEHMPLDARLVLGDINPEQIKYVFNVTGSGNNERDDFFDDKTFRFGIGDNPRTKLDYFGANGIWLGENVGDNAFNFRITEGNRAIAEWGYRASDDLTTMIGLRGELGGSGFDLENYGVQGQIGYDLGHSVFGLPEGALELQLNGWADKEGNTEGAIGLFGRINF